MNDRRMKIPDSISQLVEIGVWDEICQESRNQYRNVQRLIRENYSCKSATMVDKLFNWSGSRRKHAFWHNLYYKLT